MGDWLGDPSSSPGKRQQWPWTVRGLRSGQVLVPQASRMCGWRAVEERGRLRYSASCLSEHVEDGVATVQVEKLVDGAGVGRSAVQSGTHYSWVASSSARWRCGLVVGRG